MKDDPEFNIRFVGVVAKYSCLYDNTSPDYSNRYVQEKAWNDISEEINEPVSNCKERWRNLRGCYTRHLKSTLTNKLKRKQPYYLAECLNFLMPFTKYHKSRANASSTHTSQTFCDITDVHNPSEYTKQESLSESAYSEHSYDSNTSRNLENSTNIPAALEYINEAQYGYSPSKKKCIRDDGDPDFCFLKCMLPDMKEMNTQQKRQFRIGVLNLAQQILNEQKIYPTTSSQ